MHTIKITISYDGTKYKGWQLQKNGNTIQEEIEKAISKIFGKHSRVHGASRTDSGVHAKGQTAHFKTSVYLPEKNIRKALNSVLPPDIVISRALYVPDDFHSRFDAKLKTYEYYIVNSKDRDPFKRLYFWRIPYDLDINLMKKEAKVLLGKHDFKCFQAKDKKERSSVRTISKISIKNKKNKIIIMQVQADGFLYNMVRNIVGTLVDIGRGYLPQGSMRKIIRSKSRAQAGPTAPPQGLFLMEVKY